MKFSTVLSDFMTGKFGSMVLKNPRYISFGIGVAKHQNKLCRRRNSLFDAGLIVPPTLILSVTEKCNLDCDGCYAKAHDRLVDELNDSQLLSITKQARDLGISVAFLAGGEPFTRHVIFDMASNNPEVIFPVFTNGTLIDDLVLERLSKHLNLIPIISIEGYEKETDCRRGDGTFAQVLDVAKRLKSNRLMFGVSITTTHENIEQVTSPNSPNMSNQSVPIPPSTLSMCLSEKERRVSV